MITDGHVSSFSSSSFSDRQRRTPDSHQPVPSPVMDGRVELDRRRPEPHHLYPPTTRQFKKS